MDGALASTRNLNTLVRRVIKFNVNMSHRLRNIESMHPAPLLVKHPFVQFAWALFWLDLCFEYRWSAALDQSEFKGHSIHMFVYISI